jgi:hypothetical protein
MILNNKRRTINFQLRRFLILFLTATIIIVICYLNYFAYPDPFISRGKLIGIIVLLFLLYYLSGILRNYNFFYFTDNGTKLVFRYYSLRPMNKKQSAVEIEKLTFFDYKIEKIFFGFIKKLVLFQVIKDKIAKYPSISISLLSKKEISQLENSLKSYIKKMN